MGGCCIIANAFWFAFFGWTMPIILGVSIYLLIKGFKALKKGVKKMAEKAKELVSKCNTCGKEFFGKSHKSALRLHMQKKHQEGNCSHPNKRMLNPRVEWEQRAMQKGHDEFCPDCTEVF